MTIIKQKETTCSSIFQGAWPSGTWYDVPHDKAVYAISNTQEKLSHALYKPC